MIYYVFIDDNNGHYREYYNFISNASKQQITEVTEKMKKNNPVYSRVGSKLHHLLDALQHDGYTAERQPNEKNRCAIDRVQIHCISGNY